MDSNNINANDNEMVQAFVDSFYVDAEQVASASSTLTVDAILDEVVLRRERSVLNLRTPRKPSAWQIFLREERHNFDKIEELSIGDPHQLGFNKGRPAFDGTYSKYCSEKYKDPVLKARYLQLAQNANGPSKKMLTKIQQTKHLLKKLENTTDELSNHDMNFIVMVVSDLPQVKSVVQISKGYAQSAYDQMKVGAFEPISIFQQICRGSKAHESSTIRREADRELGVIDRDTARSEISDRIKSMVEDASMATFGALKTIPRKPGAFNAELIRRQLKWITPDDWPQDQTSIEGRINSRAPRVLRDVLTNLKEGNLMIVGLD